MTDVTRRNAILGLAAGAAAVGAVEIPPAEARSGSEDATRAAREAARRLEGSSDPFPVGPVAEAHVVLCRSWSRQVYLIVSDRVKGFVTIDDQAFAIAAACQAANRKVAVRYWGHAPEWAGAGRFDGAVFALDVRDFPGAAETAL